MDEIDQANRVAEMDLAERIRAARGAVANVESAFECENCGEEIPEKRRLAMPGCTLCVKCKADMESKGR